MYSIRFITSTQLYNDFILSTLLPPHELSRYFFCEKECISENLQKTTFFKNFKDIYTFVPHSKNIKTRKKVEKSTPVKERRKEKNEL